MPHGESVVMRSLSARNLFRLDRFLLASQDLLGLLFRRSAQSGEFSHKEKRRNGEAEKNERIDPERRSHANGGGQPSREEAAKWKQSGKCERVNTHHTAAQFIRCAPLQCRV